MNQNKSEVQGTSCNIIELNVWFSQWLSCRMTVYSDSQCPQMMNDFYMRLGVMIVWYDRVIFFS